MRYATLVLVATVAAILWAAFCRGARAADPVSEQLDPHPAKDLRVTAEVRWEDGMFNNQPERFLSVSLVVRGRAAAEAIACGDLKVDSVKDENGRSMMADVMFVTGMHLVDRERHALNQFLRHPKDGVRVSFDLHKVPPPTRLRDVRGSFALETGRHSQTVTVEDALKQTRQTVDDETLRRLGVTVRMLRTTRLPSSEAETKSQTPGVPGQPEGVTTVVAPLRIVRRAQSENSVQPQNATTFVVPPLTQDELEFDVTTGDNAVSRVEMVDQEGRPLAPSVCRYECDRSIKKARLGFKDKLPDGSQLRVTIHRGATTQRVPFAFADVEIAPETTEEEATGDEQRTNALTPIRADTRLPSGLQDVKQRRAAEAKKDCPVAEYWDGGIQSPFAKPKPFPLVVIWPDGIVVKRIGDRLMIGNISGTRLKELLDQLERSGFFADRGYLLDTYGLVYTDGPVRCLSIAAGKKQRTLYYHDRPEWNRFEEIGKDASPSRQECIAFAEAWNKTGSLLMGLQVEDMKPFQNDRPLRYPQRSQLRSGYSVKGPGWKWVANIGANDAITRMHIASLLESKGIDCAMEGSVIYGVEVPKQHAEAAARLLCDDAKKRGYWIECGEEDIPHVREATFELTHLPVDQVLSRPEFAADKPLGRFLRSEALSARLRNYPFVSSLGIREREYLATKDKMETGYEVRVSLRARADDDSKGWYGRYQVWAGGRQIAAQGGSEWSKEPSTRE